MPMAIIRRDSLLTLEAYARVRQANRPADIAHRRLRSVALGPHLRLQFEDERTVRRQIQEMLHIEKIFDEAGIQAEIEAYAGLLPDCSNWKATLLLEFPDPVERQRELARLIGVEDRVYVEVAGQPRIHAIADEDLQRANASKTSAVHFLRFEFNAAQRAALHGGAAVLLGCDHAHGSAQAQLPAATLASLLRDLEP